MLYENIKILLNNSSDLKHKIVNNVNVIYLESLCSSNKINDYIFRNIALRKRYVFLSNIISGPNNIYVKDQKSIIDYLYNGFAIVYDDKDIIACECKADLYRSVDKPSAEPSINGPKDAFNESIQTNLGLIKRRIRSEKLINEDFVIGKNSKTQVSIIYLSNVVKSNYVKLVRKKIEEVQINGLIDIEVLQNILEDGNKPLPTILKTERPDKVSSALLEGKVVIIADNSPYALILPAYFVDFINPQGDTYAKAINVNFLKILRIIALLISLFLPAIYISIINYNFETIPLKLFLSFQASHSGVPFSTAFETFFMIFICLMLRESDIRFPSTYGSSISILGALILGEAAVAANIVSPITIIIVGITFLSELIFNNGNFISGLRYYKLFILICSAVLGLYGLVISVFITLINLIDLNSFNEPYLFPLAPYNKKYTFKTILKKKKDVR